VELGPAETARVLRGGAFNNIRQNVRCANRNRNNPDNRNDNIGFRVVSHGFQAGPAVFDRPARPGILRRPRLAQRGRRPVRPVPGRA
jgi:hypothetical protein